MRVERLRASHALAAFACGNKALDDWLHGYALQNQERNLSRTFVLLDDADEVIGYYSLTMGGVVRDALPKRYGRGLPSYEIGMVLLARLAVSDLRHGQGIGRDLLIDAVKTAALAGANAAARFIAVDPIDQAARTFYGRFGFRGVDGDPGGRLFIRVDEALALLEHQQSS
jgi:predicted N-acetyltransferase YhbS